MFYFVYMYSIYSSGKLFTLSFVYGKKLGLCIHVYLYLYVNPLAHERVDQLFNDLELDRHTQVVY